jgi:deoxyguanosine kinase
MDHNYIVIEGNIGAGKTSLVHLLTEKYGGRSLLESFEDNPFLPKFYKDPSRYAFSVELFFLAERYHQLSTELIQQSLFSQQTFADYFLSKSLIFAKSNLEKEEFNLFHRMYSIMMLQLPKPDLLVYLHREVDELQYQIYARGRDYETHISNDYLLQIQESYFSFLKQQPLKILLLDVNGVDFVTHTDQFQAICNLLAEKYPEGITQLKLQP